MTVTGSNDSGAAAAASCKQGDAASSVLPCCSPGGDAGDPRPCCSMSLAMRNICSALRLSACTVLISGCFMGQPREFSFSEQGASQGHRQMGWEMAPSRGSCSLAARRGRFGCSDSTQRSSGLVLALWEMFHGLMGRSEPRDPVQLPRGTGTSTLLIQLSRNSIPRFLGFSFYYYYLPSSLLRISPRQCGIAWPLRAVG